MTDGASKLEIQIAARAVGGGLLLPLVRFEAKVPAAIGTANEFIMVLTYHTVKRTNRANGSSRNFGLVALRLVCQKFSQVQQA